MHCAACSKLTTPLTYFFAALAASVSCVSYCRQTAYSSRLVAYACSTVGDCADIYRRSTRDWYVNVGSPVMADIRRNPDSVGRRHGSWTRWITIRLIVGPGERTLCCSESDTIHKDKQRYFDYRLTDWRELADVRPSNKHTHLQPQIYVEKTRVKQHFKIAPLTKKKKY